MSGRQAEQAPDRSWLRQIDELLSDYLDALYDADAVRLGALFHPFAIYTTASGDEVVARTMDEYLPIVAARTSPRSLGQPRDDEVLSLQLIAPTIVVAVVRTKLGDVTYTNTLTFLRAAGEWRIASKVFHGTPPR